MKKVTKILISVLFCLVLGVSSVWADLADFPSALGVFGGMSPSANSGYGGLHYQRWFSKFGIQAEGGIFYVPASKDLNYSIVLDGLFPVYNNDFSEKLGGRVYLFGSAGHNASTFLVPEVGVWDETTSDYKITAPEQRYFNPKIFAALGIGIEVVLFQHFSIPLHFGYAADIPVNNLPGNELYIGFTFGGGLRYRF